MALVFLFSPTPLDSRTIDNQLDTVVVKEDNTISKWEIIKLIDQKANEYQVPFEVLYEVIECETGGTFDPNIQSRAQLWYGRERSFGLSQIHLPSHPDITESMAKDPVFAVDFMAKNFEKHSSWWMCYEP